MKQTIQTQTTESQCENSIFYNSDKFTPYAVIINLSKFTKENIRDKAMLHLVYNSENFYEDYEDYLTDSLEKLLRVSSIYSDTNSKNTIGLTRKIFFNNDRELEKFITDYGIKGNTFNEQLLACNSMANKAIKNMQDCISSIYTFDTDLVEMY